MINLIKKRSWLFIVAVLGLIAMNNYDCSAKTLKGQTKVNGKWVNVTVECDEDSFIKNGVLYMMAPWKMKTINGEEVASDNLDLNIPWRGLRLAKVQVNMYADRELHITSEEPLTLEIWTLQGEVIYSSKGKTNAIMDLQSIIPAKGAYIFHMKNKEGKSEYRKVLSGEGTFKISAPKTRIR